jgi:hypothetical protein
MPRKKKVEDDIIDVFGYKVNKRTGEIERDIIYYDEPGDSGADYLGDGMYRMWPSGDIVDYEEKCRRIDDWKRRNAARNEARRALSRK